MSDAALSTSKSLRVFLSYSRVDARFVDELAAGLPLVGNFDVTLDRHSIETGVDWKERLQDLIEEADAVVFVLSPDFLQSGECGWEVEAAAELGKRLVPVLHRPLENHPVPPELGSINYVDAIASGTLIDTLKTLGKTLKTDLGWLKQSTRLLNLAQDWDEADRPDNRLLLAADIESATDWLETTPKGLVITDLQRDYVNASSAAFALRQDEEQRRLEALAEANRKTAETAQRGRKRAMIGFALSAVLALAAGGASVMAMRLAGIAKDREIAATEATERARDAAEDAVVQKQRALDAQALAEQEARHAKFVLGTMIATSGLRKVGFDCQKTLDLNRPVEFLICVDAQLAQEDRLLNERYQALRAALEGEAREKLRDEQIAWIRRRDRTCEVDLTKEVPVPAIQEAIQCALDVVVSRNDELQIQLTSARE
jgi:uncharacterized protein YecT (DUF1311 family)